MKKSFLGLILLSLILLFSGQALAASPVQFEANGQPYTPYPDAFYTQNTLLVPVSGIAEMLGIEAKCNLKEQTITFTLSDKEITLYSGSNKAVVNGQETLLPVAGVVREYRNFLPLREICRALDVKLAYEPASKTVRITAPYDTNLITIFHAGSLSTPLKDLTIAFKKTHPQARIVRESAGSVECVRKVTEQGRLADLVISADYFIFDTMMIPQYTDWYGMFATNEMVLCYREGAPGSDTLTADNWHQLLLQEGTRYAHTDPDLDPAGYRALMVWQLAEKHTKSAGLYEKLASGLPAEHEYGTAAELIAALQAGEVDYAFEYLSVAKQNGFKYLQLPAEINLASLAMKDTYQSAKVTTTSADGKTTVQTGLPIINALTVPNNAPNAPLALEFAKFIMGADGQAALTTAGQTPIVPATFNDVSKAPAALTTGQ